MLDYVSESIVENFLLMLDLELKTLSSDGGCSLQPTTTFSSDGSQGQMFSTQHAGGGGGAVFDDFATYVAAVILRARDSKNSARGFFDAMALRHFGLNDEGFLYLHRCGILPSPNEVEEVRRRQSDDQTQTILKRVDGFSLRQAGRDKEPQKVSTEPEAIFRLATEAYDTGRSSFCLEPVCAMYKIYVRYVNPFASLHTVEKKFLSEKKKIQRTLMWRRRRREGRGGWG